MAAPSPLAIIKQILQDVQSGKIQKFVLTGFQDNGQGEMQIMTVDSGNINLVEGMALAGFHTIMSTRTVASQVIGPSTKPRIVPDLLP